MYRTVMIGILGIGLMMLTACETLTGKTAGQNVDDAMMTASVQKKLMGDKLSNFTRINVNSERGIVSLNGVVRTVQEKSRAEDLAWQVAGVKNVDNDLQIQSLADSVTSASEGQESGKAKNEALADEQSQRVEAIKGEVLRIEGDNYFVKGESGKEVRLFTDATTEKTGDIHEGDRIEAQMDGQNHALSIRSIPTTDRRNEKSESMLAQ